MAKWLKFVAPYTFSTSPHSCYRTTLLNTKVPNFTASQENCEKIISDALSYFHQFNNFWQIHDKIAEIVIVIVNLYSASSGEALQRHSFMLYALCSKCAPLHRHKR